jgi:hypothetical protein
MKICEHGVEPTAGASSAKASDQFGSDRTPLSFSAGTGGGTGTLMQATSSARRGALPMLIEMRPTKGL